MIVDGLEVFIKPLNSGIPYIEYQSATIPSSSRYIESASGERFLIWFRAHPNFNWYGAIGLEIHYSIDGGRMWRNWVNKNHSRGIADLRGISMVPYVENGVWKDGHLRFAERDFDDAFEPGDVQKESDRAMITVKVERIAKKTMTGEVGKVPRVRESEGAHSKASIKLVKDKGIGHYVKPSDGHVVTWGQQYTTTLVAGVGSKAMDFEFLYRSKYHLRKIGVCPPSPIIKALAPVDLTNVPDSDSDDEEEKPREVVDLTLASARTRVKRERIEEDEDLEAELERARQRQKDLEDRIKRRSSGMAQNNNRAIKAEASNA